MSLAIVKQIQAMKLAIISEANYFFNFQHVTRKISLIRVAC